MKNSSDPLLGKTILLFAPTNFNYHTIIKKTLEDFGANVFFYDERNNPSSFKKLLIRKCKHLVQKEICNYYKSICAIEHDKNIDYIFFVNPESITLSVLLLLKKTFPKCKFILYMWDSLKNKKINNMLHIFDKMFSFDMDDCKNYNMTFRPLFFIPTYDRMNTQFFSKYDYDLCFIGTVHSDRAKIIYQIKDFCDKTHLKYFFYLYIPGKLLYFLRLIVDPYLRKIDKKFIHIKTIDSFLISSICSSSRCIIDINHPLQSGLTMRTIEMLGLRRKILTTNTNISKYDFYRPENQIVFDRKKVFLDRDMITKDYFPVPDEIINRYSINAWIKDIFYTV